MKLITPSLLAAVAIALTATPALAVESTTPTTRVKALGKYCQAQSKEHVDGQKGTPFSQCVTALAKLKKGTATSPKAACAALSKKHVKGEKGTPFSRCVVAAAHLLRDQKAAARAAQAPTTTTS